MVSEYRFPKSSVLDDIERLNEGLMECYAQSSVKVFLLSPQLWKNDFAPEIHQYRNEKGPRLDRVSVETDAYISEPELTRYGAIKLIQDTIDEKTVLIFPLGYPSREAYAAKERDRNFYLLGALGSTTTVGIGLAQARQDLKVMVIEGDGSYLFNPNQFFDLGRIAPTNLSVVILDNGAWGSTGSQPTLTASGINLSAMGVAAGTQNWFRVCCRRDWEAAMNAGTKRIHFLIRPGNANVGTIPLTAVQIKKRFIRSINT